jgi:hypothetical protein
MRAPFCCHIAHNLGFFVIVIRLENSENVTSSGLRHHECRCIRRPVLVRAASSKVLNLWINKISLTVMSINCYCKCQLQPKHCVTDILYEKVSARLDRTNRNLQKYTRIIASAINEADCTTSTYAVRHRSKYRRIIFKNTCQIGQ